MFTGLFLYSFSQMKAVLIVQALDQVAPVPMPCTAWISVKQLETASLITVLVKVIYDKSVLILANFNHSCFFLTYYKFFSVFSILANH